MIALIPLALFDVAPADVRINDSHAGRDILLSSLLREATSVAFRHALQTSSGLVTRRKLAELAFAPIDDRYIAACFFSRCVRLAEKDTKLAEARRKELVKTYAHQAMDLLRQAGAKGYKDAVHMKKESDIDPIRHRDDFNKLIAEREARANKK